MPGPDCLEEGVFYYPGNPSCDARNYFVLNPADNWAAADFALHRDDHGRLHCLYMKGWDWVSSPDTDGQSFGYAYTQNLDLWIHGPDVFSVSTPGNWDDDMIWAPCIIEFRDEYYMFYTGVTDVSPTPSLHTERIGLAVSRDLTNWTRVPINNSSTAKGNGCIFEPDFAWSAWSEAGPWRRQCRDPHVFRDDATNAWYMTYSTTVAPYNWTMVAGLAKSTDLVNWQDLGPISVTRTGKVESTHVIQHDGRYYLFWTYHDETGIMYSSTTDLVNGSWAPAAILDRTGFPPQAYTIASEAFEIQPGHYLFANIQTGPRNIMFRSLQFDYLTAAPFLDEVYPLDAGYLRPELVNPQALEIDNGFDDNCNGYIDEPLTGCIDGDGDGFGVVFTLDCQFVGQDCDDNDPDIHPDAAEICGDGIDNNCNGLVDEGCRVEHNWLNWR